VRPTALSSLRSGASQKERRNDDTVVEIQAFLRGIGGLYVLSDKRETRKLLLDLRLHFSSLERIRMVTLEEARKVITAAEKKAAEIKQPMNIAVVDA
jgi:ERCC4-type nuclease